VARVAIHCGSRSKIEAIVGGQNISFCPFILVIISKLIPRKQLRQWFPTGEEFLPREEFHEFRAGISTFCLSYLFVVQ